MNCTKLRARALLILSGLAVLTFPILTQAKPVQENTIDANPKLPGDAISWYFGSENWPRIKNLPYDSYVIFRGRVMRDHTIRINRVEECQADDAHLEMARALAAKMQSSASPIGSHIQPTVDVFVVFYESCCQPGRALVFSKATTIAAPSVTSGGDRYMRIISYDKSIFEEAPAGTE